MSRPDATFGNEDRAHVLVNGPYYRLVLIGEDGIGLTVNDHTIIMTAKDWFALARRHHADTNRGATDV